MIPFLRGSLILVLLTGCAVADGEGIDLDFGQPGWVVESPHNTLRREDGRKFPTVEQGKWFPPVLKPDEGKALLWFGVPASAEPKDRVETKLLADVPMGGVRYSSFRVRFPADFPKLPEDSWFVFHQWHQSSPESPPLAFEIKPGTNDTFMISTRWADEDGKMKRKVSDHPLPLGQWLEVIVKWQFAAPPEKGEATVWLNGEKIYSYQGPLGYRSVPDQLIDEKFGVYRKGSPHPASLEYARVRSGLTREEVSK